MEDKNASAWKKCGRGRDSCEHQGSYEESEWEMNMYFPVEELEIIT